MKVRKEEYIPEKLYTHMNEILREDWDRKTFLGLHSSDSYPELTHYKILEGNIKCEECRIQLGNDIIKKVLKELHLLVWSLREIDNEPGISYLEF